MGLSLAQVRSFLRSGLLSPERGPRGEQRFSFQDIVILRTAKELMAARIHPRNVRRSLRKLRAQLPKGRPLSAVRISAEGDRVVVRDEGTVWNPESGQVQFDFAVADLATKVAPLARKTAEALQASGGELDACDWYNHAFDLEAVAPQDAQQAYLRAVAQDPGYADAHVNLGRLLHEEGKLAEARAHYEQALAAQPENATAAFNLGVALEDLDRPGEAIMAYEKAIRSDPGYADAHYNLACLYEQTGKRAAALRHMAKYKRLTEG